MKGNLQTINHYNKLPILPSIKLAEHINQPELEGRPHHETRSLPCQGLCKTKRK